MQKGVSTAGTAERAREQSASQPAGLQTAGPRPEADAQATAAVPPSPAVPPGTPRRRSEAAVSPQPALGSNGLQAALVSATF